MVEQRLHTYRTNRTLLCLLQTLWPETGDYTGGRARCQVRLGQDYRIYMIIMIILKSCLKYHSNQVPQPIPNRPNHSHNN